MCTVMNRIINYTYPYKCYGNSAHPPPKKKIKIKSQLPRDTSFRRNIIEQNRKYHSKLKKKISHTNLAIISKILVQVTTSITMKYIPGDIKINIFILTLVKASYDHGYF